MAIAHTIARRATCRKRQIGAVLFNAATKDIVAVGYNGAPRGLEHCTDRPLTEENGHCAWCRHAERNVLQKAGARALGTVLYVTGFPCYSCAQDIVQGGVSEVVFGDEYPQGGTALALLRAGGVILRAVG